MQPNNPQRPNPAGQRPQFFDVVRPGRTPASPNSRPVLASNRPPVQDASMMKMGAPAVPANLMSQKPAAPAVPAQPIRPPTPTPVAKPQPVVLAAATPQLVRSMPAAQRFAPSPVSTLPAQQPAQAIPPTPEPTSSPAQESPAAHQKHSIWSEVLAVLAIVLLVAIILNILLDAEIINLPLPHTNFFDY